MQRNRTSFCRGVILLTIFLQRLPSGKMKTLQNVDILDFENSKTALFSPSIFSTVSMNVRVNTDLEEYVPLSSRDTFRGEYKKWPTTFETFLAQMKLPILNNVNFILFTAKSPDSGEHLNPWKFETLKQSSWNSSENLKILIHGYGQNAQTQNMPGQLKDAYLSMGYKENILLVNWGVLAGQKYFESAMYSHRVGQLLAEFLLVLKNGAFLQTYASIHMIGFCLGAHVAAAASYHLKKRVGESAILGRITGLDPAGPGFYTSRLELRLDSLDAAYVDVIHTNGGLSFRHGELGTPYSIGKADFFPNGGLKQPICTELIPPTNTSGACHHLKAPDYYKRSIEGELFRACQCPSWSAFDTDVCKCDSGPFMGEHLQRTVGKYYLHIFEYTLFEMFEHEGLM